MVSPTWTPLSFSKRSPALSPDFSATLSSAVFLHANTQYWFAPWSFASPFDPIFYLHHCNIDRLWALWNTRNANSADPLWTDMPFTNNFINTDPFHHPQGALSLFVYNQSKSAYTPALDRAWAGAFTLIVIVVILYVGARLLTRRNALTR